MDTEQAAFERGVRAGLEAAAKAAHERAVQAQFDSGHTGITALEIHDRGLRCDAFLVIRNTIRAIDPATIKDTGNVHNQGTYNEIP